jgi:DNA polymerase III delta prime subunit
MHMATTAVLPAMNGEKTLHAFFIRPQHQASNDAISGDEHTDGNNEASANEGTVKKKRKARASAQPNGKTQKTLQEIVNPGRLIAAAETDSNDGAPSLDTEDGQVKRRRTSEVEYVEVRKEQCQQDSSDQLVTPRRLASPQVIIPYSSPLPETVPEETQARPQTPPKKLLRINARGKFSSPVTKKPKDEDVEVPKRRGRPRKLKDAVVDRHLIAVIRYKHETEIGSKIDRILIGEERYTPKVKMTTKKQRTPRKQQPSKPTHPLFLGKKGALKPPAKEDSPRKASAVTPGKLRRQTLSHNHHQPAAESTDIWTSALLKDRLMMKHPGAKEPSWPTRDAAHVRGLEQTELRLPDGSRKDHPQHRKRKHATRPFPEDESLLVHFRSQLVAEEQAQLRSDGFYEPHASLSVPQRLLIPGEELAVRVAQQLLSKPANDLEDEVSRTSPSCTHPALQKLYDSIPQSLTAFDDGRGEATSWNQKYAPSTAAEVLQPSKEITVLKEWLKSLTVTAVESMTKVETKTIAPPTVPPRKKRKRKTDEMDDFLVESDEELHDMDELTDPKESSGPSKNRNGAKSIVHVSGDGVKLSNAVLLSGPHGCGKTAAAYAVAKDLGFKVFEISSSERRSGKDVQEKVGDMTENHLVKHHGVDAGDTSTAEEPSVNEEAFQRDLASGRQGKMSAFFKPKVKPKQAVPKKQTAVKAKSDILQTITKAVKKPAKDQQQSLILLEEVDVLFKDDKDFWTAVLRLISTSKRPFIMTCNDEDMVPLQAMSLHAILRFEPPPLDLAVDYLLLLAACEGHIIQRDAVSSLFVSKKHDLRASIAELDFWCQMGVGDPKGGLGWIFQRYPPGSDLDERGRQLRVVSEGTYTTAMSTAPPAQLDDADQLLWKWREHGKNPVEALGWHALAGRQHDTSPSSEAFASFASALSAADVYSGNICETALDTTQKPMPDKGRSHYIEGLQLLQTDEVADYARLRASIAASSALAAYRSAGFISEDKPSTSAHQDITESTPQVTRRTLSCFDPISLPSESALSYHPGLTLSTFDGPLNPIVLDLAPYVRSIVSYDLSLAEQRERLNEVVSGGRNAKNARTTRAARSALEGSQRSSTRKERWFGKGLNYEAVLATGGEGWPRAVVSVDDASSKAGTETPSSSMEVDGS